MGRQSISRFGISKVIESQSEKGRVDSARPLRYTLQLLGKLIWLLAGFRLNRQSFCNQPGNILRLPRHRNRQVLRDSLTRRSRNQRGLDKRLTAQRNRLLLISIHLIRTTAISLPTLFEGGRLLVLKLKDFAVAAGPVKAVAK